MIRRATMFCLMLVLVGMAGVRTSAADCNYSEVLKLHWDRTRDMLLAIVDAMPEDKWDYRPVKEVRSFREMVLHLAEDGYSHMGYVAGMSREDSAKLTAKYAKLTTKADLMQALKESYDHGDKILDTITDQNAMDIVTGMRSEKMTRVEAALVAFEDQMDHYGNFVVYLRLNGIVPPDTVNAQKARQKNQPNQPKEKPDNSMPGMSM